MQTTTLTLPTYLRNYLLPYYFTSLANFRLLLVLSFFVLFASRPDHTVRPITTDEGSKRVFLRKEVLFGGLDDEKESLGGQNSPKHDFLGLNRHFKPNL